MSYWYTSDLDLDSVSSTVYQLSLFCPYMMWWCLQVSTPRMTKIISILGLPYLIQTMHLYQDMVVPVHGWQILWRRILRLQPLSWHHQNHLMVDCISKALHSFNVDLLITFIAWYTWHTKKKSASSGRSWLPTGSHPPFRTIEVNHCPWPGPKEVKHIKTLDLSFVRLGHLVIIMHLDSCGPPQIEN